MRIADESRKTLEDSEHRLMNRPQLRVLLPVSDMTIWRMEQEGTLPRHLRIGNRAFWKYAEVIAALKRLSE